MAFKPVPAAASDPAPAAAAARRQYCIRRCSVARLLPAMAWRTHLCRAPPLPGQDAGTDQGADATASKIQPMLPTRAGVARAAPAGAAARRGTGLRFEQRSTPESSFSQFASEAERMSMESVPGRLFTDLVEFSSVSREDVLDVLKQVSVPAAKGGAYGLQLASGIVERGARVVWRYSLRGHGLRRAIELQRFKHAWSTCCRLSRRRAGPGPRHVCD